MDIHYKTNEELREELTELRREFYYLSAIKDIDNTKRIQLEQELADALQEITFQNEEKEKRAAELIISKLELKFQSEEEAKRAADLVIANIELVFQNKEKAKLAAELIVVNKELIFQNEEKEKRAAELIIAKEELLFQNKEKEKRAVELDIANKQLAFDNKEKDKREAELDVANKEKEKRANELLVANKELAFQNKEKEKRAAELIIANKELAFQNKEKDKRAAELDIANKQLAFDNKEKDKRAAELDVANKAKEKRANELLIANKELAFQNKEKEKRAAELIIANKELAFQNKEKEKRAADLTLAKEKAEDFENKFRQIAENIDEVFWLRTDSQMIYVSPSFEKIWGVPCQAIYENPQIFTEVIHPADKPVVQKKFQSNEFKEKGLFEYEYRIIRADNQVRWINAKTVPIVDESGQIVKRVGIASDITEKYETVQELIQAKEYAEESEQKTMSIMENSADAIFVTNQQGNYVYTNKTVSIMLGYTSEEMKSKTIADISPPDKTAEYFDFFKQILNKGKGFTEIELLKKDGNYISTDLNAVLLPDGSVYGSCRDITERKEAKLGLIKAKEKAEESDRLKSAFLANMSHEIRTPMNGILGFAELLTEPDLTGDKQQEYIKIISKSGLRMLNIINNIVEISKIEAGLMEINPKKSNIIEQMEFVYAFFKPEVESKGLQLVLKKTLSAEEAIIKTDREKVYAILTNLVNNAIKYTIKGSIVFGCDKKGDTLEFFVKDTGIGIPTDRQAAIFERFIQADIADKMARQGAGLGLSISKAYVEMLGGNIWVESEEDLGSTFYFTLPYNVFPEEENVVPVHSDGNQINPEVSGLKILIAEDDETSEMIVAIDVDKIGKEILIARTGFEAVEICRNNPDIDLILMDIQMPEMNGYDATRQIRQFNKDAVIIAQTAFGLSGDREKAIAAGCNDYISKPIIKAELRALIQKYFRK